MTLRKSFFATLLLFCSFSIFAANNASTVLNDLLSNFRSMSATFKQQTYTKGEGKSSSGTMALQRPGKFRWEVKNPNHQLIVADGQYIWVYDIDLEQAARQSLTQDPNSPAILLSGSTADVENRFTITSFNQSGNTTTFQLKPREGQELVKWIELEFVDKKLTRMAVIDTLGSKNVFYFYNVKINPPLSNSLFNFHPPKGVDIIKSK